MTAHQQYFFGQSQKFDAFVIKVRFLDDQATTGFEHSQQIFNRLALIAEVVQRIDHKNPVKKFIGKRKLVYN